MRASLEPSTDRAEYSFFHRVRTRFAETDAMGVIHHGSFVSYLEETRVGLLRTLGRPYDEVRAAGIDFAVIELVIRYRRPVRFDDVVVIAAEVGAVTRTTFQVGYLLEVDGEPCATAVTVHEALKPDGRPARVPPWVAQLLGPRPA